MTHAATPDTIPQIGAGEYVAPVFHRKAFHCPNCGVYAGQKWLAMKDALGDTRSYRCECFNCRDYSWWLADPSSPQLLGRMVEPEGSLLAPAPHVDMPDDCRKDYEEARAIVERSPRGACGLLRVVVQKLCIALGQPGENLNADIGRLVSDGLDPKVQRALDSLRVIGNAAVHPGEMSPSDDPQTAGSLFGWINFIVDQMITRPRQLDELYDSLPETKRGAIEQRDAASD